MSGKINSGARAKVSIVDPVTNETKFIGMFSRCDWNYGYDAEPAYILGRYGPASIDYTSQLPVSLRCGGWRVIGHGAHVAANLPALQNLMQAAYVTIAVEDRQTGAAQVTVVGCRPVGYSTGVSARGLQEISIDFIGLCASDESTENEEGEGAMDLPDIE